MNVAIQLNWRLSAKLVLLKHYACRVLALDIILFLQQALCRLWLRCVWYIECCSTACFCIVSFDYTKLFTLTLGPAEPQEPASSAQFCLLSWLLPSQLYPPFLSLSPSESLISQLTLLYQLKQQKRFRFLPNNQAESVWNRHQTSTTDTLCREGRNMQPHKCFPSPFRSKNFGPASLLVCVHSQSPVSQVSQKERNSFTEYSELEGTHKDLSNSILQLFIHLHCLAKRTFSHLYWTLQRWHKFKYVSKHFPKTALVII